MNFCTFGFLPRVFFMPEIVKPRDTFKQTTNELLNLKQFDLFYAATILTGRSDSQQPTTKYYVMNLAPFCTTIGN
jgi:hypothetical protein